MKDCPECGSRLNGDERYCSQCKRSFSESNPHARHSKSLSISNTTGDIIGPGVDGIGNLIGKEIHYTINGPVFNINIERGQAAEILNLLRKVTRMSTQIETNFENKKREDRITELRETQLSIDNFIGDVNVIEDKTGIRIQRINAGQLQIYRNDLILKEALAKGTEFFYKYEYESALEWYNKAIEVDPKNAEAWFNKGTAYAVLGKYEEVVESCEKAIEAKPDYTEAWNNKGNALYKLGRYEEAIECYDKALKIRQDSAPWNNKGIALQKMHKFSEAIESYDKALEIKPDFAEALNNKGTALNNLGKYPEAVRFHDRAIKIQPNYAEAWFNKAMSLYNLGRFEESKQCYDKAQQLKQSGEKYVNDDSGEIHELYS